jgi:hypothetical protein
MIIFASW